MESGAIDRENARLFDAVAVVAEAKETQRMPAKKIHMTILLTDTILILKSTAVHMMKQG